MKFTFSREAAADEGALVVGSFADNALITGAQAVDAQTKGTITKALKTSRFKGKIGDVLTCVAPGDISNSHVILIGFGKTDSTKEKHLQDIGGHTYAELKNQNVNTVTLNLQDLSVDGLTEAKCAAAVAYGLLLRAWHFDKYYTVESKKPKHPLKAVHIITNDPEAAEVEFKTLQKIADGIFTTRTLVSEPPNVIYPETMANAINEDLSPLGIKVEIFGQDEMQKLGMGSLLGVGQGSIRESKMVVMQWNGADASEKPVAFIGKGVTFDTGGISIKPSQGMEDMKYDMAGAAAVVGTIKALAGRKAKVNAIGVVGLVENMPSGSAIRPSDILTSMSGQTIEVLNTDAEGRLVLCDALWYTQDRFKPKFMINLATLTGAIVISLGDQFAGLFSNDDDLSKKLTEMGEKTGERLWRFPLDDAYDREIDSTIADMKNISNGRKAGSITAAQFLQRFVNKTPWAHLDIAGMAWAEKSLPTVEKGASGYGVRLLNALVETYFESK
ncbi:MAG: leucyl aminopeptidase [Candidatus Nucleicultricaceae bacterium]